MNITTRTICCLTFSCLLLTCITAFSAAEDDASRSDDEQASSNRLNFFEERIRPILVDYCYKCHSDDQGEAAGGLRLHTREGIRRGGLTGPAIVPGDVDESLLLAAIQYSTLQMPPDEKLPDEVVEDFRKWISDGAEDSRSGQIEETALPIPVIQNCSTEVLITPFTSAWMISIAPVHCWPNGFASAMFICP